MVRDLLAAEKWDCMEAMNLENATSYLSEKIKEALDIVAPVETKVLGKKPVNLWTTAGLKVSLKNSNNLLCIFSIFFLMHLATGGCSAIHRLELYCI